MLDSPDLGILGPESMRDRGLRREAWIRAGGNIKSVPLVHHNPPHPTAAPAQGPTPYPIPVTFPQTQDGLPQYPDSLAILEERYGDLDGYMARLDAEIQYYSSPGFRFAS